MGKSLFAIFAVVIAVAWTAPSRAEDTWMDEFDPRDPKAEQLLQEFDKVQEQETGLPSWLETSGLGGLALEFMKMTDSCYQDTCNVFARVSKRNQKLYLSVAGKVQDVWDVSSGMPGYDTPDFDRHPSGRIYDHYSSSKYPGGDWKGLGNMPYAVFIQGGYALHGTPQGNWPKLGTKASHGCIRIHPDNAKILNRLVRANGIANTWITVED